ncbi:MAG: hypothetical protein F4Y79_14465 [Gemmatimonadetes bacterium]|nr:hypothetical protein [Gemmatimonadota bacterium]MDE2722866.1 hypothetical protein [Gemmatimonadota bacterium]MXX15537.1 hypothetical protein [Gemmatimonadota bacterium]MXZ10629.1 hypothetical protein [Gemmatimonadota bacterium]MYB54824.1 hypothetical protein [Gemmatimonadota bacterium]
MTVSQAAEIRSTLIEMFEAIEKKENIAEHLLKLDDIQRSLDRDTPAQLRHFLERRSYTKALEYLDTGTFTDDPNRPDCDDHPH